MIDFWGRMITSSYHSVISLVYESVKEAFGTSIILFLQNNQKEYIKRFQCKLEEDSHINKKHTNFHENLSSTSLIIKKRMHLHLELKNYNLITKRHINVNLGTWTNAHWHIYIFPLAEYNFRMQNLRKGTCCLWR